MDKLTAKKLVMVRNIIIVLGIVIAFAIWLLIPAFIENMAWFMLETGAMVLR